MDDLERLAAPVQRLAEFAAGVAAASHPSADPAGLMRAWLRQASLIRQWPAVRQMILDSADPPDAELAARARSVALRCRTHRPGVAGKVIRLIQRAIGTPPELLEEAAELLERLADELTPVLPCRDLVTRLDAVLDQWRQTGPAGLLAGLQEELFARQVVPEGWLDQLAAGLEAPRWAEPFAGRLGPLPDPGRAAVGMVRLLAADLAERTGDSVGWSILTPWAGTWLSRVDLTGQVALDLAAPAPGAEWREEVFPLRSCPGRVVVFRLQTAAESGRVAWEEWAKLSGGRSEPGSVLERFHELYTTVGAEEAWWAEGRWDRALAFSLAPPASPDSPAVLIGLWLDLLENEGGPDTPRRLQALAAWAERFGLSLVSPNGGDGPAQPGVVIRLVFSDSPRGTVIRMGGHGLIAGNRVFRHAVVELSLGSPPPGFLDLEAAAQRLAPEDPLRARVALLRQAIQGDYLREAAIELYVDTWGERGAAVRTAEPALAGQWCEQLTRFLSAAYGLTAFRPTCLQDHPDGWLVVVPGSRPVTGLVRRVHRPGLQDEKGNLCIPALVEVE